ncbi:hypothetical protein RXV95_14255 [Novosphingobium sp. ZN18A2]|uniref:hypothetical protein n=1 Tax=Novosphingobium sp. ZN18A2 TaxID=3079861 RepID=UPI0030CAC62A
MRKLRTAVIAGAATIGLAGTAFAATRDMHVMNVNLPDGSVAKIEYAGKIAPKIEVVPVNAMPANAVAGQGVVALDPFMPAAFGDPLADAGFANLDRVVAMMDARTQAMMQQAAAMEQAAASGAPAMQSTSGANTPAGSWQYTVMTSSNGSNACTRTVEWSSTGASAKPRVTRTSAGDCDAVKQDGGPVPAAASKPAKVPLPGTPA